MTPTTGHGGFRPKAGEEVMGDLIELAERLRKIRIATGRDERSQDYADGYEDACEMAADEIDEIAAALRARASQEATGGSVEGEG